MSKSRLASPLLPPLCTKRRSDAIEVTDWVVPQPAARRQYEHVSEGAVATHTTAASFWDERHGGFSLAPVGRSSSSGSSSSPIRYSRSPLREQSRSPSRRRHVNLSGSGGGGRGGSRPVLYSDGRDWFRRGGGGGGGGGGRGGGFDMVRPRSPVQYRALSPATVRRPFG